MKKINFKIILPILGVLLIVLILVLWFANPFKKQEAKSMDYYIMNISYYNGEKDIDFSASYSKDSNMIALSNNVEEGDNPYEKSILSINPYELIKSNLNEREIFKDKVSKKLTMTYLWNSNLEMLKILPDSSHELSCEFENLGGIIGRVLCKNDKEELVIEIY